MDQGASIDDLVAYREELPGLAMVLSLGLHQALTFDELVGTYSEAVRALVAGGVPGIITTARVARAAGFPLVLRKPPAA